jgi:hypothetical protein
MQHVSGNGTDVLTTVRYSGEGSASGTSAFSRGELDAICARRREDDGRRASLDLAVAPSRCEPIRLVPESSEPSDRVLVCVRSETGEPREVETLAGMRPSSFDPKSASTRSVI